MKGKRKGTPARWYEKQRLTGPKHTRRKRAEALGRMTVNRAANLGYTIALQADSKTWMVEGNGLRTTAPTKGAALGAARQHYLRLEAARA